MGITNESGTTSDGRPDAFDACFLSQTKVGFSMMRGLQSASLEIRGDKRSLMLITKSRRPTTPIFRSQRDRPTGDFVSVIDGK